MLSEVLNQVCSDVQGGLPLPQVPREAPRDGTCCRFPQFRAKDMQLADLNFFIPYNMTKPENEVETYTGSTNPGDVWSFEVEAPKPFPGASSFLAGMDDSGQPNPDAIQSG
eukprot:751540-Hanusia_phi.AAC.1